MADREGLGNLPIFDTEIRTSRELVAQEQRQEDDYQYIIGCIQHWRERSLTRLKMLVIRWNMMEAECLMNIWTGQCFFQWQIRSMTR